MDTMPERYETTQTTTNVEQQQQTTAVSIGLNLSYLRSLPGILKLVEAALGLIIIICVASIRYWSALADGGYITFVGTISMILTLILFFLHLTNVIYKIPGPVVLIEFIYLLVIIFLLLIAGIVAAVVSHYGGGAIAASIFSFITMIVYGLEALLCFRVWRGGNRFYVASRTGAPAAATATTTTTTTTTATVKQENYVS